MSWKFVQADRLDFLNQLPEKSVDLVFGSPPYEAARTYGINFNLKGQEWVDWMVETYRAATRACKGLVAFVVEGQTRKYRWSATPALLMADLHRAGFHLRRPVIYHRVGIPGSGGPDWLRADTEYIVCVAPSGKLPWSDNTACGHKPKWERGGQLSYRLLNGERVNEPREYSRANRTSGYRNGDTTKRKNQSPVPDRANPGTMVHCKTGGGHLGSPAAHDNEAPFPLKLADFFVRSFCQPAGLVCDCFSGSGTTAHAAVAAGRNFIGCDIRESQVKLATRRLEGITPEMSFVS